MEPRLVDRDKIKLVGLPFYGDPANGNFTKAWHRLMQIELPTQRVNETVHYGVELYGSEFHQEHQWMYFPSVEVQDLQDTPGILFAKTLPASRYAVFHVTGGLSKISEIFRFAYDQWIPASDYEVAYPYDFEYYGEDFKGDMPESEMDLYIPIKPKQGK
jgi:AraC family transcriptional regulator